MLIKKNMKLIQINLLFKLLFLFLYHFPVIQDQIISSPSLINLDQIFFSFEEIEKKMKKILKQIKTIKKKTK